MKVENFTVARVDNGNLTFHRYERYALLAPIFRKQEPNAKKNCQRNKGLCSGQGEFFYFLAGHGFVVRRRTSVQSNTSAACVF